MYSSRRVRSLTFAGNNDTRRHEIGFLDGECIDILNGPGYALGRDKRLPEPLDLIQRICFEDSRNNDDVAQRMSDKDYGLALDRQCLVLPNRIA